MNDLKNNPQDKLEEKVDGLSGQVERLVAERVQLGNLLMESGLSVSGLPEAAKELLRQRFGGRSFTSAELQAGIEESRKLVAGLTGHSAIQGPRLQSMFSSEDQLQAAADDLLGAPRQPGMENLHTTRLTGIKELYMLLTGDHSLYGGYYADRVQLATSATFPGLVKNAMNKIIANEWSQLGAAGYDWWLKVARVEHFESLHTITGILVGTVGTLPGVAEGAEYTELAIGESPETADFAKYGGYIPLTLELIDKDNTRALRQYPLELAKSGMRLVSQLVAQVFTLNSGTGPTLADGGALFNTTAVTSAGGHTNLRTAALTASEWENVSVAVFNQPMLVASASGYYGTGSKQALNPRYLLVPRELRLAGMKILYPAWENAANIHSENLQQGALGDVVVVPEWTDSADWAAACDPAIAPAIIVGERFGIRPEIFIAGDEASPAYFMNDEYRLKVRHFAAVLVQDFRPLHKNNVA